MNTPEKGIGVYVKKSILYGLFTVFNILLFITAEKFVQSQKYFSLTRNFSIPYLIILLILLFDIRSNRVSKLLRNIKKKRFIRL